MSVRPTGRASQFTWAAEVALRAPSIFNTQPWRWRVTDDALDLWADRTRQLANVDPEGRLLVISCGAALHHAITTLTAGGDATRVAVLPDPVEPDLLAHITIAGPLVPDSEAQARFAAITRRRSDRGDFAVRPVLSSQLDRLRVAAEAEGAHLLVLRSDDVVQLATAAGLAAQVEDNDPGYQAELAEWTHRPRWGGDGIDAANIPAGRQRRVPIRSFSPARADETGKHDCYARYAVLWTEDDEPQAWLRTGRALSALMLDATTAGLAVSPISDVIEVEGARAVLRRVLAGLGHPLVALRIGYPSPDRPDQSARRPVTAVIDPP